MYDVLMRAFYGEDLAVNFCGRLATDGSPQVRREFRLTVADWLTRLPSRRDHEARLLPYLLQGLLEPNPQAAQEAFEALESVGEQYERDRDAELKDLRHYLPQEAQSLGWLPAGLLDKLYDASGKPRAADVLPRYLVRRPRLGCRLQLQGSFPYVLGALCAELGSWQDDVRQRAAALLPVWLAYVEDVMSQHVAQLLPALLKAYSHSAERGPLSDSSRLLGVFVPTHMLLAELTAQGEGGQVCHQPALPALLRDWLQGAALRDELGEHAAAVWLLGARPHPPRVWAPQLRQDLYHFLDSFLRLCPAAFSVEGSSSKSGDGGSPQLVAETINILLLLEESTPLQAQQLLAQLASLTGHPSVEQLIVGSAHELAAWLSIGASCDFAAELHVLQRIVGAAVAAHREELLLSAVGSALPKVVHHVATITSSAPATRQLALVMGTVVAGADCRGILVQQQAAGAHLLAVSLALSDNMHSVEAARVGLRLAHWVLQQGMDAGSSLSAGMEALARSVDKWMRCKCPDTQQLAAQVSAVIHKQPSA